MRCTTGWAHPRRCGEHLISAAVGYGGTGSSPQVRGTYRHAAGRRGHFGLIPAGAGNIPWSALPKWSMRAHPRRCGEHDCPVKREPDTTGSSPQVRGTYEHRRRAGDGFRLIPAGAGNIPPHSEMTTDGRAHPRRCGEHSEQCARPFRILGLIPAGAGNMSCARLNQPRHRAHPRRCGEHENSRWLAPASNGSSPQVRGTSLARQGARQPLRLIPAGAGNMRHGGHADAVGEAHPRRCGEHSGGRGCGRELRGLIPAGAGNMPAAKPAIMASRAHPRRCGEHTPHCWPGLLMAGSSPQVRGT